jgi:hypothetical protein
MPVIQVLLDSKQGPLPLKGQFQPLADTPPSIFLSGTAQANGASASCEVQMEVWDSDHQYSGFTTAVVFSNEARQHKNLLALLVNQKPFTLGTTYSYQISPGPRTISDQNDSYSVTILY